MKLKKTAKPLEQLRSIQARRAQLKLDYNEWLAEAVRQGYSNNKIAEALNVTETAIRNYRKRNGL